MQPFRLLLTLSDQLDSRDMGFSQPEITYFGLIHTVANFCRFTNTTLSCFLEENVQEEPMVVSSFFTSVNRLVQDMTALFQAELLQNLDDNLKEVFFQEHECLTLLR